MSACSPAIRGDRLAWRLDPMMTSTAPARAWVARATVTALVEWRRHREPAVSPPPMPGEA
jgi:hypothetical protein